MNSRREILRMLGIGTAALALPGAIDAVEEKSPLNILLFTADDLGANSLGCFGGVKDASPNLDAFAAEGLRFENGHVNCAICAPSRSIIATGMYGHNSSCIGFRKMTKIVPTIMQTMRDAGYLTGVLGKVSHSTPNANYKWDYTHDYAELGSGRDPEKYFGFSKEFFAKCKSEKKPFYFMVNSHDPHRPFHNPEKPMRNSAKPSRLFTPDEIQVPGYVPDNPGTRIELSHYFNSVRRLDDTFGRTMDALKESGLDQNTLVMFISDNGLAIPFGKANVYLKSTKTPWLVRWSGVVKPKSVNKKDFIASIDFFPTVLDATGLKAPGGFDGRTFLPILKGQSQTGREKIFTQIDEKIGGAPVPMRCIQNLQFGYIYNAWSNDKFVYKNNNEGNTMKAMNEAAKTDPKAAARVKMYRIRVPEEFYNLEKDPDCLNNLINDPEYKDQIEKMRMELLGWMKVSNDPLRKAFENRDSREVVDAVIKDAPFKKPPKSGGGKSKKKSLSEEERRKKRQEKRKQKEQNK